MRKKHVNNYWKGTNTHKVPYCEDPAVGMGAPYCSENCYKYGACNKDAYFKFIAEKSFHIEESKQSYCEGTPSSHICGLYKCHKCGAQVETAYVDEDNHPICIKCKNKKEMENGVTIATNYQFTHFIIDGREYYSDEIIEILKKHKEEEDKKYLICDKCGIKYLENKKFNMIHENLENDMDLKPGMAIGYQGIPFITGIQITSKCGIGKKIKLCDNCIKELVLFLKGD